jgi:hypothetical protein
MHTKQGHYTSTVEQHLGDCPMPEKPNHPVAIALATLLVFAPVVCVAQNPVMQTVKQTAKLVYPNGIPATDATVVLDSINNATHAITTSTFKPDQTGNVTATIDPTRFAGMSFEFYVISPTGIAFWPYWTYRDSNTKQTLTLQPFTSVRIHLVDDGGKPVSGVRICPSSYSSPKLPAGLWNQDIPGDWTQTTDASGNATLSKLPQGFRMALNVLSGKYAPPDDNYDIQLANYATTPNATVLVGPGSVVSGTVRFGPSGKPVAGILVDAQTTNPEGPGGSAITDSNGAYTVGSLSAGTYKLLVGAGYGEFKDWIAQPQTLTVATGTQNSGNNIPLIHGGLITGQITDGATGNPLPNIQIMLIPFGDDNTTNRHRETITDANGNYHFRILPGTVTVCPFGVAKITNIGLYAITETDYQIRAPQKEIAMADGDTKTLNFKVATPVPYFKVHALVLDPQNKPVPGAEILAMNEDGTVQTAKTDPNGLCILDSPGLKMNATIMARCGDLGTPTSFVYTGENPVTLHVTTGTMSTIEGQVKTSDGKLLANADIMLILGAPHVDFGLERIQTDAQGRFTFPPVFGNLKYSMFVKASGYASTDTIEFIPTGSHIFECPTITMIPADSFAGGTVVDSKGNPIANATVTNDVQDAHTKTDAAGHFILKGMPRDKTGISVQTPDGRYAYQDITCGRADNIIYVKDTHE